MNKKLYTGAYLLEHSNGKKQFGTIDASYGVNTKKETSKIYLSKKNLSNFKDEDGLISFEISHEQLKTLATTSMSVYQNVDTLKKLALRDKLNDNAYLEDVDNSDEL